MIRIKLRRHHVVVCRCKAMRIRPPMRSPAVGPISTRRQLSFMVVWLMAHPPIGSLRCGFRGRSQHALSLPPPPDAALIVMENAAIAHECSALRRGNDLTKWIHTILSGHRHTCFSGSTANSRSFLLFETISRGVVATGYHQIQFGAIRWTSRATHDFLHREIPRALTLLGAPAGRLVCGRPPHEWH